MTALLPPAVGELREVAEPALRAAVGTLHPRLARVVAYHRGWTDREGRPQPKGSGKALRPALALLCGRAAGGAQEHAVTAAVAVEMVHDFSLLHDDLMDGDTERRHRPTAWVAFGVADATLAGDALLDLATRSVLGCGSGQAIGGVELLHRGVARLVQGQAMDVDFETRLDVELRECLDMERGKTGALIATACGLGALLAGGSADLVEGLTAFGEHLGLAFQLVDDLLGIWGDPDVTGKPVTSDLRRRKKSVPVVAALDPTSEQAPPDGRTTPAARKRLLRHLSAGPDTPPQEAELAALAALLDSCGARRWTADTAAAELALAEQALAALDLNPDVAAELVAVARFAVDRSV
jgi:geranylgeranyl diphosphate synthase type I